ncbi:GvpL/GvpF family gas vesicle protein [Dactylosporangium sp. NPDC048998]|uniref:GvpL/GvpF family gas vesicle protein n=1 Tax=Dactylosporangium sp. NPDC048998 TaxID=3363976 RepID=UPI003713775F
MTDDAGIWLHAVAREFDPAAVAGLTGVGGGPLRVVEAAGLAAVVSPVDLNEFGAEPMRRNLEDLAWLERVARAHHGVVAAAARLGPVVPARLGTVYLDDTRVRAMLSERRADFVTVLERVAGRTEWGVKAYTATGAPAKPEPSQAPAAGGGRSGAGAAYLRRRRAELSAGERRQQAALDSAEEVHAALGGCAEGARRHPPQDRSLSGEPGLMVLNGAYLVDAGRAERFRDTVAALAGRFPAIRLQLTGPWPPYSFATIDEEIDKEEEASR